MIRLTRTSIITQRDNTMLLPIEGERVTAWLKARNDKALNENERRSV